MLAWDQRGAGDRPVLLLHGFLGSGRNLWSLARRWADAAPSRRILLPDLTGHGASPQLPPGGALNEMAADVLALAAHLALPTPMEVVGHSLGGRVALAMRLAAPQRVAPVTLLDISPGGVSRLTGGLAQVLAVLLRAPDRAPRPAMRAFFLAEGVPPALPDWALLNLTPHPDGSASWRIDRAALATAHAGSFAQDLWPALAPDPGEVTCIRGGASPFVSEADAARLRAAGATVHTLAGAGHFVHVDAAPALVALLGP